MVSKIKIPKFEELFPEYDYIAYFEYLQEFYLQNDVIKEHADLYNSDYMLTHDYIRSYNKGINDLFPHSITNSLVNDYVIINASEYLYAHTKLDSQKKLMEFLKDFWNDKNNRKYYDAFEQFIDFEVDDYFGKQGMMSNDKFIIDLTYGLSNEAKSGKTTALLCALILIKYNHLTATLKKFSIKSINDLSLETAIGKKLDSNTIYDDTNDLKESYKESFLVLKKLLGIVKSIDALRAKISAHGIKKHTISINAAKGGNISGDGKKKKVVQLESLVKKAYETRKAEFKNKKNTEISRIISREPSIRKFCESESYVYNKHEYHGYKPVYKAICRINPKK